MPLHRAGPADERPQAAPNAPLHFALQYIDGHHPYLATRGLTAGTIRTFQHLAILARGCANRLHPLPPDGSVKVWSKNTGG